MPVTFLLLQLANLAFGAATLWIRFQDPFLWDDQAIVFSTAAGALAACVTVVLLGLSLVLGEDTRWGAVLLNLALALGFAGLQGYFLFLAGRDMGVLRILKARLGGG